MNRIVLHGCRPEPLISYLKALGILRLVTEQADDDARGAWEDDAFALYTILTMQDIEAFFAKKYTPTPILGPWAGGSGFFKGDNEEALNKILNSATPRLSLFRQVISEIQTVLKTLNQQKKPNEKDNPQERSRKKETLKQKPEKVDGRPEKPDKEGKHHLLRVYRQNLPDKFVEWMDSAIVLQNDGQKFPPVLGTGGNDGRLDFTQNFMQRLVDLNFQDSKSSEKSVNFLKNTLWGTTISGLQKNAIGQFDPGKAGGPNATQGIDGDSFVNPWDYVLMLEGALLMAGSVTHRLNSNSSDKVSFPFTVDVSSLINESVEVGEDTRGELWCPLWENPARLSELQYIFSEGRAQVGTRQARNTVEFARAITDLGTDRGLKKFTRYGFLKRSGKAFISTTLGRFEAQTATLVQSHLLSEIDEWLYRYRSDCKADNVQPRFTSALRGLETAIFNYCKFGDLPRLSAILRALGVCEYALSQNPDPKKLGIIGKKTHPTPPIPILSADWIEAAKEDSAEFRIALALATLLPSRENAMIGVFRSHMESIERRNWGWSWPEDKSASVMWQANDLVSSLNRVLHYRLLMVDKLGLRGLPLESAHPTTVDDIKAFVFGQVDDTLIESWLWGLVLTDLGKYQPEKQSYTQNNKQAEHIAAMPMPRAYHLLKLLFLPEYSALKTKDGHPVKPEPAILAYLQAGQLDYACTLAYRRLHATGYVPMAISATRSNFYVPSQLLRRLSAALLIPLAHAKQLQSVIFRNEASL